ncbi:uncharacterized protein G2W53_020784 [Senna tora]|uniref:Uncharacterized protein n=1 Tax=Senna tora TaxID=362788 RepID=A0A834TKP0_9FABA|nr:uncharacterized protein G2W53_020784 [Senna tora]
MSSSNCLRGMTRIALSSFGHSYPFSESDVTVRLLPTNTNDDAPVFHFPKTDHPNAVIPSVICLAGRHSYYSLGLGSL